MNKQKMNLALELQNHDFTYMNSDDSRVFRKGLKKENLILGLMRGLECPFTFDQLCAYRSGHIDKFMVYLEDEQEAMDKGFRYFSGPGYYHMSHRFWRCLPYQEEDLISEKTYMDIMRWFSA